MAMHRVSDRARMRFDRKSAHDDFGENVQRCCQRCGGLAGSAKLGGNDGLDVREGDCADESCRPRASSLCKRRVASRYAVLLGVSDDDHHGCVAPGDREALRVHAARRCGNDEGESGTERPSP